MNSAEYYQEHLNLLKTQMESQELQKQETSQAMANLGYSLNLGLEKIAKAMPKQLVVQINMQSYCPQMTYWYGRWWYWNGYGWV